MCDSIILGGPDATLAPLFIDSLRSGVAVLDRDFRVDIANSFLARWTRPADAEFTGGPCFSAFPPRGEGGPESPALLATSAVALTGPPRSVAVESPTPRRVADRPRVVAAAGALLRGHPLDGERRVLLEVLSRLAARYRTVVEQSNDAVWFMDPDGRVAWANDHLATISGGHPGDWRGACFQDRLTPASALSAREAELRRADGTAVVIAVNSAPWLEGDTVKGTVNSAQDVTAWRRAEKALADSGAQLRQAQKMGALGLLVGSVAHDFNNLLTVILADSAMVKSDLAAGKQVSTRQVADIQTAGERALDLTRQLLNFAHKQVAEPELQDVNAVVTAFQGLLRCVIRDGVTLRVDLEGEHAWVQAGPGQLEQVLMNLAINACDAMPRGGTLTIQTSVIEEDSVDGPWVSLRVVDTGTGMSPDVRAHLAEPFFTTKGPGKGTGLGLSTVFGIAKLNGGRVVVKSEPGQGTSLEVLLPRVVGATFPAVADAGC